MIATIFGLLLLFQAPIKDASSKDLINCLQEQKIITQQCGFDELAIEQELISRKPIDLLISNFNRSKDQFQKSKIILIMYAIDDQQITLFMKKHLSGKVDEQSYYIANYLAKLGDQAALKLLNNHYYKYPVSSAQWANTIEQFGKYKYQPAINNLIDSLNAASLNVADAALHSLKQLFPDSPDQFKTMAEATDYYHHKKQH